MWFKLKAFHEVAIKLSTGAVIKGLAGARRSASKSIHTVVGRGLSFLPWEPLTASDFPKAQDLRGRKREDSRHTMFYNLM